MNQAGRRTQHFWSGFFFLWFLFISGIFHPWTNTPGLVQLYRLKDLQSIRIDKLREFEQQITKLESDRYRLEHNSAAQEREIRKTLGYAAPKELIFDFIETP